ncbi:MULTISPECIES: carbohydrate ABC transporter permease [unclassified Micromonospora]|uniref:carbohydrate ABC transporter permease n=1 Tax=unclassified Micromonospora TaxID=2617518 RepID=UPI0022BB3C60|nr:carbohydrate ABC transporter permease [Micromonospora sp. AKA38]GHJ15924.1 sugar ABC transporter permease [Micromonospora sp. AKA38]
MTSVTAPARRPTGRRRAGAAAVLANGWLWLLALLSVFPIYWLVSTSFLPKDDILQNEQRFVPDKLTLENYRLLLANPDFWPAVNNSLIVSVVVTVGGAYLATMAGYAFAKLRFRGRDGLFRLLLVTMMIPLMVSLTTNYVVMSKLGLLNSLWAVILPQLTPAFGIFWMRQYVISAVPEEILEAARIDGAGEIVTFRKVVLPILRPGVAGLMIWLFLSSWTQLLLPLTYLQDQRTYPVFINALRTFPAIPVTHLLIAASVLSMVPVVALFVFAQRSFVAGMSAGAVKG